MRFIASVTLFCLICAASAQEQEKPVNSEIIIATTAKPGPISRIFFWFKKPEKQVAGEIAASRNPLNKDDSADSLPQEKNTDRVINDAITDRLLQESQEQSSVAGSPFIADDKSTEDHQASASENEAQQASPDRSSDGYGKSVANQPADTIPIEEALRIVRTSNLVDCVARVICELSCNANSYGNAGRVVFRNMIKLQFDQSIQGDDAKFYRQSAAKGRQIVQGKRDCQECYTIYPTCKSNSNDLVAVSSMFKL